MSRPTYRPTLESLERREVFSASSLLATPVEAVSTNDLLPQDHLLPPTEAVVVTDTLPAGVTNNGPDGASRGFRKGNELVSQVAAGDVNGDGTTDIITSSRGNDALLLPYIEQDNVYKLVDSFTSSDPLPPGLTLRDKVIAENFLNEGGGLWNDSFNVTGSEGGGEIFNNGGTLNVVNNAMQTVTERPAADLNDLYALRGDRDASSDSETLAVTHDSVFEQWGNLNQRFIPQTDTQIIAILIG